MDAASREMIKEWIEEAQEDGCTHLMVVCDTYDHSDYPVEITSDMDVKEEYEKRHQKNMQQVMEVYNLSMDIEEQLLEYRAVHF